MSLQRQGIVVTLVWITLAGAAVAALVFQRWELAFVAAATFAASLIPAALAKRMKIRLPVSFLSFMVVFIFYLFEGDKYAAPPWATAFFGWCFAVAIGTMWEIFEFAMDQTFGMNMQKSGLMDTMTDLIVDVIGGAVGAFSGFLYLKGLERGGLLAFLIADFVEKNRRLFQRRK